MKVELSVQPGGKNIYRPEIKVGNQSFYLEEQETNGHARWFLDCFAIAMKNAGATVVKRYKPVLKDEE